jgi:CHASE3 domain sensor protein
MSRLHATLGRKLGLAFAAVTAIFVVAMVLVLFLNAKVEST